MGGGEGGVAVVGTAIVGSHSNEGETKRNRRKMRKGKEEGRRREEGERKGRDAAGEPPLGAVRLLCRQGRAVRESFRQEGTTFMLSFFFCNRV
jgi:ribosomal protein L19E